MDITINARTLTIGGVALAIAGGAYFLGAVNRSGSPAQTLVHTAPADQSSSASLPGITVTGTGTVNGTPDTLILDLSVSQTRSNVSDALSAANGTVNDIDSTLTAQGVAGADVQTSGASVQPNYQGDTISGYAASESLTVTLRDLTTAGSEISAAVRAGGNATSVNGVSLDIQNDTSLMSAARSAAFADAQTKAQQYASAAHETLGKAVQVTETVNTPQTEPMAGVAAPSSNAAVPINPGTSQVSVTVTVVFSVS
ncbi:MAG TPA: SIMPL domain-containing protein [Actinocrinis sp.]|jgi:hypothetical protein